MRLAHLPEPWRPNAVYKLGDRVTVRHRPNILAPVRVRGPEWIATAGNTGDEREQQHD